MLLFHWCGVEAQSSSVPPNGNIEIKSKKYRIERVSRGHVVHLPAWIAVWIICM